MLLIAQWYAYITMPTTVQSAGLLMSGICECMSA